VPIIHQSSLALASSKISLSCFCLRAVLFCNSTHPSSALSAVLLRKATYDGVLLGSTPSPHTLCSLVQTATTVQETGGGATPPSLPPGGPPVRTLFGVLLQRVESGRL